MEDGRYLIFISLKDLPKIEIIELIESDSNVYSIDSFCGMFSQY